MKALIRIFLLIIFFIDFCIISKAQIIDLVKYSTQELRVGEEFSINLTIENEKVKNVSNFPEIPDFIKKSTLFSKKKSSYSITQNYIPLYKGNFVLNDFYLYINFKPRLIKGSKIYVNEGSYSQSIDTLNLQDFIDPISNFKLVVDIEKLKNFKNESNTVKAYVLVNEDNKQEFNFYNVKTQLKKIVDKIRPQNCWLNDISSIKEITSDTIIIKGEKKIRYMLYEGLFAPLDTGSLKIPSIDFSIIQYKLLKTPNEIKRIEKYVNLKSDNQIVKVKSVLNNYNLVAGEFKIAESISKKNIFIGQPFDYKATIFHNGLPSMVFSPQIIQNHLQIFAPIIKENINTSNDKIMGSKSFLYTLIANDTGTFPLRNIFCWPYYNTSFNKLDTLWPTVSFTVKAGFKQKENSLESNEFLDLISNANDKVHNLNSNPQLRWVTNALIILMLLTTIIIIFKK